MEETKIITALTYTFPKDAVKAALTGALLPASWRRVWCVESRHADMPVPEGVEKLVRDFPRGGTLGGAAALEGMARVFSEFADEAEPTRLLVKLDSDTALWRPEAWTLPFLSADVDFTYIRRHYVEGRLLANGCCYALSKRALKRFAGFDPARSARKYKLAEDLAFSSFLTLENVDLTFAQIDKSKCFMRSAPYGGADAFCAHLGYFKTSEAVSIVSAHLKTLGKDVPDVGGYVAQLEAYARTKASMNNG